jgi:CHAT domain-containing protein
MKAPLRTSSFNHPRLSQVQLLVAILLVGSPIVAQQAKPEVRPLVVGQKTERSVSSQEEVHIYSLELKRGQLLRVTIEEKGADVTAAIARGSDQQKVSALTNSGSGFMRESLTLLADRDDTFGLVVRAQRITDPNAAAQYEYFAAVKNAASRDDIARINAERLMEEATKLLEATNKGSLALAVTKFDQSQKIWQALGDRYWAAIAKASMGSAYFKAENFPRGELYLRQALKTFEQTKNEPAIAAISLSLAGSYTAHKNLKAARPHLSRAFEISKRLGDKRLESLGGLLGAANLFNESDPKSFNRALAAARAKYDKLGEASLWAKTLFHYLAEEDSIPDQDQKALFERAEREALPLMKVVKNRDIESQILFALGVGFYDLTLGDDTSEQADRINKDKSMKYLCQAIVLAKTQNNLIIQALAYTQLNLYYDGDNDRLAIYYSKRAIVLLQELREDLKIVDKETQQYASRELDEVFSTLAEDLLFESRLAEAQQVINFSRDQEFFDLKLTQNRKPAKLTLTSRESESEQLLDNAITQIVAKYAGRQNPNYQVAGAELRAAFDKVEQSFVEHASEKDIATNVPDTVDMQAALHELSAKTNKKYAVLYFVADVGEVLLITEEGISAFTSSTSFGQLSTYVSQDKVDEYIADFLKVLQSPNSDPRPIGSLIYNKIFQTVESVNGKQTNTTLDEKLRRYNPDVLLWSLSGNIRYIPIAALYDANRKQYLVEEYQNAVFTRARKERFLIEPKPWVRGIGFGTSLPYFDLAPLRDVPNELSVIFGNPATKQKGFFAGEIFLNRAFTRQALLAIQQTKPDLVHIASHFRVHPGNSQNSFLLLGDGTKFSLLDLQQNLNLFEGVDLLTLSACETAAQQAGANGKEVDGFAELAQRLGATSVIATLWQVSDLGTSKLMTEFYRLRQQYPNAPKSEILQQAQLKLLNGDRRPEDRLTRQNAPDSKTANRKSRISFQPGPDTPFEHPYFWAPFVLFGSSR